MITKDSFIAIMNTFDAYYNGDIMKGFKLLGVAENAVTDSMDAILEALERDLDPKRLARIDEYTYDCGAFITEWLIGEGEFQEVCKDAAALYDYVAAKYEALKET